MASGELRKLAQDTGPVNLYEVDATPQGMGFYRFHSARLQGSQTIHTGGLQFLGMPIHVEGIEISSRGKSRPRIEVGMAAMVALGLLKDWDEFIGATLRRFRILQEHLDDGASPDSTAIFGDITLVITQLEEATRTVARYRLGDPSDAIGSKLPRGRIIASTCATPYRGETCQYSGVPLTAPDGTSFVGPLVDRGSWNFLAGMLDAGNNLTHYKCDEGTGTTVANQGDSSDVLTLTGATWGTGRTGAASCIVIGAGDSSTAASGASIVGAEGTCTLWVKTTQTDPGTIARQGSGSNYWEITLEDDGRATFSCKGPTNLAQETREQVINDGLWHMLSLRWGDDVMRTGIDDSFSAGVTAAGLSCSAAQVEIGHAATSDQVEGSYDDIRLMVQNLQDSDILALFQTADVIPAPYVLKNYVQLLDPAGITNQFVALQTVPRGIVPGTGEGVPVLDPRYLPENHGGLPAPVPDRGIEF